jgi:hypothetical protein
MISGDVLMTEQDQPKEQPIHDLETKDTGSAPRTSASEPAIRQLDTIIENLASYATPVLREIAARAADLAAKAGEAAGPMAQRAADKTEAAGGRLASKGREVASDLRRDTAVAKSGTGTPPLEPVEQTSAEEEAGLPPR